jgi:undecaprenyl diphosphate synthase
LVDSIKTFNKKNKPKHIAIIMDGNGRWASDNNQKRVAGHRKGVEAVKEITKHCVKLDIKYLTLYTFSNENWSRPKSEILALMNLLVKTLDVEI